MQGLSSQRSRPQPEPPRRRAGAGRGWAAFLAALGLLLAVGQATAQQSVGAAAPQGVVPIVDLLREIRKGYEGSILKVELEQEWRPDGRIWVYEAKLLTPEGQVVKLEYDARSLELIEVERPKSRGAKRVGAD